MDRRFESADWLIVSGGLLLLIASRPAWWILRMRNAPQLSLDGFDFAITGIVPLVVLLSVTVLTIIIKSDSVALPDWLVHPYLTSLAVAGAAVLVTIRFFWSGFDNAEGVVRGLGMYLAMAGVVIALLGCVVALRALGRPVTEPDAVDDDDELDVDVVDDEIDEEEEEEDADDGVEAYGYYAEEDDLVRRFNTTMPSGETPVYRRSHPDPAPRRVPPTRQPAPRRGSARPVDPAAAEHPRPPLPGPPLP